MHRQAANFERDFVGSANPNALALVEFDRAGNRTDWRFDALRSKAAGLAGTLTALGLKRGDVVLTLIGNRPEWVCTMLACFRIGAVALACSEQLRAADLSLRLRTVPVSAIVVDDRNLAQLSAAGPGCAVLSTSDGAIWHGTRPVHPDLEPTDPAVMVFTSGTAGEPKCAIHGQRYLWGQTLQARHWMRIERGDLVWCTASTGWSKSVRNSFIASWLRGGTALLHDARFNADERLAMLEDVNVNVLCMAPTEYRSLVKRANLRHLPHLHSAVAAGEALDPDVLHAWREATGIEVRDGYGQTETGQVTAMPAGDAARPGSMGRPLPGVRLSIDEGELVIDPSTLPTFFLGYQGRPKAPLVPWRTGDLVHADGDGYLYFEGRNDDLIISSGYRIGPVEVESALLQHPAIAEAAVVADPDEERGNVVRAVVVLRSGYAAGTALAHELQQHVRSVTAPYKYPRVLEFADSLPKTTTGKLKRADLRRDS
jgi:acyl-coenzyme A synthetase/AMP-(fatty) acid ligase